MNKEKTLKEIKKNFDDDLKKGLEPLHDIQDGVHENTVADLRELFEAVGNFAYDEAIKEAKRKLKKGYLKLGTRVLNNKSDQDVLDLIDKLF